MYKERRDKVSIKFYILIALIILIIVFAIMLLIPKKKTAPKKEVEMQLYSKLDMDDIKAKYSASFYENLNSFKDASFKYFVKKVSAFSNKEIVTLDNLINDNHFLATLTDDEGNKCDEENSDVTFIKNSNNSNYKEVITLICGQEETTLSTYVGEYDYCEDTYCEKQIEKTEKPTKDKTSIVDENNTKITTIDDTDNNDIIDNKTEEQQSNPASVSSEYTLYEYVLTPNDNIGKWSEYSDWSQDKEEASLYKEIDVKTETSTVEYDCSVNETQRYIAGYKDEQYIAGYVTTTTVVGKQKDAKGNITNVFDTKTNPVYGTRKVPIYKTRYINDQKMCTKEDVVEYYRYRTFSYKKGINYVKYSSSDNDQYLIAQGYTKTGKTK